MKYHVYVTPSRFVGGNFKWEMLPDGVTYWHDLYSRSFDTLQSAKNYLDSMKKEIYNSPKEFHSMGADAIDVGVYNNDGVEFYRFSFEFVDGYGQPIY